MSSPLEQLSAGALGWLGRNLDHFHPFSPHARPVRHGRAKATLELALLRHCAARLAHLPQELAEADALVRKLWQDPDFPRLFDGVPAYADTYRLVYAALTPDGVDRAPGGAWTDPGFLGPDGKSPYRRIEIRHYADKAGMRHGIEPYAALVPRCPLVTLRAAEDADAEPLTTPEAYALTHTAFYLGDFGRRSPGLGGGALAHARDLVDRMLRHCVRHDRWDLAAELMLTQFVLGDDPPATDSGAAALECLLRAQRPDGALPGRSAALAAAPQDPAGEFFAKAYHTTLVTALMALVVSSARPS
ncbi:DUF6895 family protein [Streptomyces sp. enrichment culture]|uniref:DUF6895 family protein n=1 Tax=Streptomyces sp. enrichment culture TaxID=1795815 RepID=UPI003F544855